MLNTVTNRADGAQRCSCSPQVSAWAWSGASRSTVPQLLSVVWRVAESDLLLPMSRRLVASTAHRIPLAVFAPPIASPDYALVLAFHPRVEQAPEDPWFRGVLVRAADALDP